MDLPGAQTEQSVIAHLRSLAEQNVVNKSFIGTGYYDTYTPPVIQRNVLENPGWYTAYTPYQPEVSQGTLHAIYEYQTLVTSLLGMDVWSPRITDPRTERLSALA